MVSGPVRCSFALRPAGSLTRRPGLLHQGLRAFHCFKARLGCYRLERKLPGGFALPLEFCAFPRRTQTRTENISVSHRPCSAAARKTGLIGDVFRRLRRYSEGRQPIQSLKALEKAKGF